MSVTSAADLKRAVAPRGDERGASGQPAQGTTMGMCLRCHYGKVESARSLGEKLTTRVKRR